MRGENLSEYCVKPRLVIVHDPSPFGALERFSEARSAGDLLERFLFRESPCGEELRAQHLNFVNIMKRHVDVVYLADILGASSLAAYEHCLRHNPNHLFTHDALITIPWIPQGYILGRMKKTIRQTEPVVLAKVARILALKEIVKLPPHLYLEGGDLIPLCHDRKKTLLMGYGPRTSKETLFFLRDTLVQDGLADEIVGVQLAEWRLNIDGCFFPVSKNLVVSNPESIVGGILLGRDYTEDIDPLAFFTRAGFAIIEATREESYFKQACNFMCLGNGKFLAYNLTDRINGILRTHGLEIIGIDGDQLVKGNGGPHCMTRPVYGGRGLA